MQLLILILGLLASLLSYSGFGNSMNLSLYLTYFGIIMSLFWFFSRKNANELKIGNISFVISTGCVILFINMLQNWHGIGQLTNFLSLFGIVIGASLLSRIQWSTMDMFKGGIVLWGLSWFLLQMLMPGRILSGWNSNSAICIFPSLICGLCMIRYSEKYKFKWFYGCLFLTIVSLFALRNRSSILSLLFLGVIAYPSIYHKVNNIKWFRILYILALFINVGFPLFNDIIGQLDIYNEIMSTSQEFIEKDGGFSGRDVLWRFAIFRISVNPIFGTAGVRDYYFHNFSCDALTQFGWLGWIVFTLMYVALMEKCYKDNGQTNIFLFGFMGLLMLNTFENALLANNLFTIFPYFLFALAWQLKSTDSNQKALV